MIVSKPKSSTLISIGLFLLLNTALIIATINSIVESEDIFWYHYVFLTILVPIALGVLIKTAFNYKITIIAKNKIQVKKPLALSERSYQIRDIKSWEELKIKTASGIYLQLEISFENGDKLSLGKQEHTEYEKIKKYLSQKAGKKKL